ncbi:MAG: NUDIX domain-containing protein [Pseudomonadota bacterium]
MRKIGANPVVRRLFHAFALATRPMTLGTRVLITDDQDRILLIKHTYVPGWYLPGGGVDVGETIEQAARREVREETGLGVDRLTLFGLYYNTTASRRDHVALFLADGWRRERELAVPNREISDVGFFARTGIPEDVTPSTRRRLGEVFDGSAPSGFW